jgi:hypothetical protein
MTHGNCFTFFYEEIIMHRISINSMNRTEIQRKYIDYIISHMDFMEIRDALRDYLNTEKNKYSDSLLRAEISKHCPEVLVDSFADSVTNVVMDDFTIEGVSS